MIIMADPSKASALDFIHDNIKIGEMYNVYAMSLFEGKLSYLIFDMYDERWWVDDSHVKIVSNIIPAGWFFRKWIGYNGSEGAHWGFKELIFDDNFYAKLMDTVDPEAIKILRHEQKIRTEIIEQYDVVKLIGDLPEYKLKTGTLGVVESKTDIHKNEYEISFFNTDGSKREPVKLPREYIVLDMKIS